MEHFNGKCLPEASITAIGTNVSYIYVYTMLEPMHACSNDKLYDMTCIINALLLLLLGKLQKPINYYYAIRVSS